MKYFHIQEDSINDGSKNDETLHWTLFKSYYSKKISVINEVIYFPSRNIKAYKNKIIIKPQHRCFHRNSIASRCAAEAGSNKTTTCSDKEKLYRHVECKNKLSKKK